MGKITNQKDKQMTVREVADALGVSRQTIYRAMEEAGLADLSKNGQVTYLTEAQVTAVNGILYFTEAVHKKNNGWFSLSSAYRPEPLESRLRRYSDATQESPGAYARNAPPSASSPVSEKTFKKSSIRLIIKKNADCKLLRRLNGGAL